MENNLVNKSRFFAQYWGQKVLMHSEKQIFPHGNNWGSSINYKDYLELKPLSNISDEDFNLIMNDGIMNPDPSIGDPVFTFEVGGLRLSDLTTTDYLRSKGYALPWMGLSVEELVIYGWVKLKKVDDETVV